MLPRLSALSACVDQAVTTDARDYADAKCGWNNAG
jgi:hypothetical protein